MFSFLKENINFYDDDASALQEYIVYLAHEIKTPVNSIYDNLTILKKEACLKNMYLDNALLSAEYLINFVNSTLNIDEIFHKRVTVRTFGDFDIFVDGELIEFKNQKAKELFAICIDNCGGEVTMKNAIEKLWEGRDYDDRVKRLYRKAVTYLNNIFKENGLENIFTSVRGSCHVNKKEINCDYYEVLEGKNIKETLFDGRYMTNYSWSEETCGRLCQMASIQLHE